jgi:hypothetical protein
VSDWVVIASGPSLTEDDVALVKDWRDQGKGKVCVINTTFRLAPWADVLYACDRAWWDKYGEEAKIFTGKKYCYAQGGEPWGAERVTGHHGGGLCNQPGEIRTGGNSGHQAVSVVYNLGAKRIILLGFDMGRTGGKSHWHGDHPHGLSNGGNYPQWIEYFRMLAKDLKAKGVDVINCTRTTNLDCFPQADIASVLG